MTIKRIITAILLILILATITACNPAARTGTPEEALVEVVRGDLAVTVSGSGNIEVSEDMVLTFGSAGKVDKIFVEEHDKVKKSDILARLETDSLELAVAQAQIAHNEAEAAIPKAQLAIIQAELALKTAEYELDKAEDVYKWPELEVAYADVERARYSVDYMQDKLADAYDTDPGGDHSALVAMLAHAQQNLIVEEAKLNAMLSGADKEEVAIKKLQVEAARQSLDVAQQALELAQQAPELTQQSLELAQKQLDKAALRAPFDGVVASVYVDEGDTVLATTYIIRLIDLTTMELVVGMDEIDIAEVEPGQKAIIEVDALADFPFEGTVSSISVLPNIEGGVILYDVKIEFEVTEDTVLRTGMSATADIVLSERNSVLLVPSRAIKEDSEGNTIVNVVIDGKTEERAVITGISDGLQTEIVDGLREGEIVATK